MGNCEVARYDNGNRTKYWLCDRVPGMSAMRADFTTQRYAPHTHDAFVIATTEVGGAEISNRGDVGAVNPSVLFVSNPGERQSARMARSKRWVYRSLYLSDQAAVEMARRVGSAAVPYFDKCMLNDHDLIARFARLHRALEADDDTLQTEEALVDVFGELFWRYGTGRRPEAARRDRSTADRVVAFMQERYEEYLTLDSLADVAGLTSFQLINLFKNTLGLTPHAYLIQIRLNAACRHLRRGCALAESALASGFCDQSALTKHFKCRFGFTPMQYTVAVRAG